MRHLTEDKKVSYRTIARQIGIAQPTLKRLVEGETGEPYGRTRDLVEDWLRHDPRYTVLRQPTHSVPAGHPEPGRELLELFLDNMDQFAEFVRVSAQGLAPEDRRTVALALLTGMKRLMIAEGMPISPQIYELERKFVADSE